MNIMFLRFQTFQLRFSIFNFKGSSADNNGPENKDGVTDGMEMQEKPKPRQPSVIISTFS